MTTDTPPPDWTWGPPAAEALAWLVESGVTGAPETNVMPPGCADSTWVLHHQYLLPAEQDLETSAVRQGLGFLPTPPPPWARVRWQQVAEATGQVMGGGSYRGRAVPPCYRWSGYLHSDVTGGALREDPAHEWAASEGSPSQEELEQLIPVLVRHTSSTQAIGVLSEFDFQWRDLRSVERSPAFTFTLARLVEDLLAISSRDRTTMAPHWWWPQDRAWLVWTDWDLSGTKVYGSAALIEELREHPVLETIDWHPGP